jgi:hypothetical protein
MQGGFGDNKTHAKAAIGDRSKNLIRQAQIRSGEKFLRQGS